MARQFDHFVIAVHDLGQAGNDYRSLGFTVVDGGEHADGMSRNLLIAFQDGAYLEIIAFTQPLAGTNHRWAHALAHGEGLVTYALLVDELDRAIPRLQSHGLPFAGPVDGGRLRPDGQRAVWRSGRMPGSAGASFPFIIEDVTDHALRVPGGADAIHPNGVTGAAGLREVVADLDLAVDRYRPLLETAGSEIAPERPDVARAARFPLGRAWLDLLQPAVSASPLRQQLGPRGSMPYELILDAPAETCPERVLPLALTHGARIRITPRRTDE